MDLGIAGKRALVAGSASGIGAATVKMFAVEGVSVVVNGRNAERAEAVRDAIIAAGSRAAIALGDQSSDDGAEAVMRVAHAALGGIDSLVNNLGQYEPFAPVWTDATPARWAATYEANVEAGWAYVAEKSLAPFGKIDVLVNNAGLTRADTFDNTDLAFMRRMLDVNIIGSFLGMKAVRGPMKENGGGVVINVALGLAFTSPPGILCLWRFEMGRARHDQAWRQRTQHRQYQCGDIDPRSHRKPALVPSVRENASALIPLGRVGGADEFSCVVVFIASDDASYVPGAEFLIDGAMIC